MAKKKTDSQKTKNDDQIKSGRLESKMKYKNENLLNFLVNQEKNSTSWKQLCFEKVCKLFLV